MEEADNKKVDSSHRREEAFFVKNKQKAILFVFCAFLLVSAVSFWAIFFADSEAPSETEMQKIERAMSTPLPQDQVYVYSEEELKQSMTASSLTGSVE